MGGGRRAARALRCARRCRSCRAPPWPCPQPAPTHAQVDTEKYPSLASRYSVQALPTLILFKGGQPVDRFEGLLDAAQLRERLEYFVPK